MPTRRQFLAVGAALGGLFATAGCADVVGSAGSGRDELQLGVITATRSFAPSQAQLGHYLPYFQAVYDPVVRLRPDGSVAPGLATAWEYDESRTRLTLRLRDDVVFTDGTRFDSAAVRANVEAFQTENGPLASMLRLVQGVETPSPDVAVVVLSAPDPGLLDTLGSAGGFIASPAALGQENLAHQPVGSGPYLLDQAGTTIGVKYTFVRNPDHWGEPLPFERVVLTVIIDGRARLNALKAGQLDGAFTSSASDAAEATSVGLENTTGPVNFEGLIMFDREGRLTPELGDVRVRRALSVAINREGILRGILLGLGEPTGQIFRPGDDGYLSELDDAFPYDPDEARRLLAEAGLAGGLEIDFPVYPSMEPAVADAVIANWSDVGVRVRRLEWAGDETIPNLQKAQVSLAYFPLAMQGTWRQMTNFIAEKASWNTFKVAHPTVTDCIARYQRGDTAAATELNRFLVDQVWFAPFYRPSSLYLHNRALAVQAQARQATPALYNYAPAV
ncbi:ABC transporter substrate-binding protein [Pseudonocardia sichuanensis]